LIPRNLVRVCISFLTLDLSAAKRYIVICLNGYPIWTLARGELGLWWYRDYIDLISNVWTPASYRNLQTRSIYHIILYHLVAAFFILRNALIRGKTLLTLKVSICHIHKIQLRRSSFTFQFLIWTCSPMRSIWRDTPCRWLALRPHLHTLPVSHHSICACWRLISLRVLLRRLLLTGKPVDNIWIHYTRCYWLSCYHVAILLCTKVGHLHRHLLFLLRHIGLF